MFIHIVSETDTIGTIATKYNVPEFIVRILNNLEDGSRAAVGQALLILQPLSYHTVSRGETLYSVARLYGTTLNELFRNNPQLNGETTLYPGQTLIIEFEKMRIREMDVNGYAYPYVNMTLLRTQLPYINYMTPFTYGITEDGELVDLNDAELIRAALDYGVLPLMHLSTLTKEGNFSNELASIVLNDPEIQDKLIDSVIGTMRQKGYRGLDVDFEFVYAEDSLLYAEFIGNLRTRLNPLGYEVIAALAPKTSDEQRGLLYQGHRYAEVGDAANAVLLMTYEWGYTYGPPLAVAPINNVRQVVDYALTRIDADKIFLGIPNYGYDWTLPYVKGESRAASISNVEAVQLAVKYDVPIEYDEVSQSPRFRYTDEEGREHEVWFEDVRSIQKKFELIEEKQLRGAGYWNLMRPFQQNWSLLNYMFEVKQ